MKRIMTCLIIVIAVLLSFISLQNYSNNLDTTAKTKRIDVIKKVYNVPGKKAIINWKKVPRAKKYEIWLADKKGKARKKIKSTRGLKYILKGEKYRGKTFIVYAFGKSVFVQSDPFTLEDSYSYDEESGVYYPDAVLVNRAKQTTFISIAKNGGYYRIICDDNGLAVTKYNEYYRKSKTIKLKPELKRAVGFHESNNYKYVIYANNCKTALDKKEVLRVVKYDTYWRRISDARFAAQGITSIAKESTDVAEYGNYIFIHTDHIDKKLKTDSNIVFKVNTESMKFEDSTRGSSFGYSPVDNRIAVDDKGNIVLSSIFGRNSNGKEVIAAFKKNALDNNVLKNGFSDILQTDLVKDDKYHDYIRWPYPIFSYISALMCTEDSYLTVRSYLRQSEDLGGEDSIRNIIISAISKKEIQKSKDENDTNSSIPIITNQVTNYEINDDVSCSRPKIVRLENNKYIVIWEEIEPTYPYYAGTEYDPKTDEGRIVHYENETNEKDMVVWTNFVSQLGKLSYVIIDGKGNKLTNVKTVKGYLSDCTPKVKGGKLIWLYTPFNDTAQIQPRICFLDPYRGKITTRATSNISLRNGETTSIVNKVYTGKKIIQPKAVVRVNGEKLRNGKDYTCIYKSNKIIGKAKMIIKGKDNYYGSLVRFFKVVPKGTHIKKIKKGKWIISIGWKKQMRQTDGYILQLSRTKSFKKGVRKIYCKSNNKDRIILKANKYKKAKYVRIRTYKKVKSKKYFSKWSSIVRLKNYTFKKKKQGRRIEKNNNKELSRNKKGLYLVKSVTRFYKNSRSKALEEFEKTTFYYNKKDPVRIKNTNNVIKKLKYNHKKGKKKSCTIKYEEYGIKTIENVKYNKREKAVMILEKNSNKSKVLTKISYGKKGYVKRIKEEWSSHFENADGKGQLQNNYIVKLKHGLPIKIKTIHKENGEKRSSVSIYNKKGLVKKTTDSYSNLKYVYKYENGRAVQVLYYEIEKNDDGSYRKELVEKCVIKYNNISISKKRYSFMINSIIGYDTNHYCFPWY